jgi:hypothetical protein
VIRPTTAKPFMRKQAVLKPKGLVKRPAVKPKAMIKYGYYVDDPVIKSVNQGKSYKI